MNFTHFSFAPLLSKVVTLKRRAQQPFSPFPQAETQRHLQTHLFHYNMKIISLGLLQKAFQISASNLEKTEGRRNRGC